MTQLQLQLQLPVVQQRRLCHGELQLPSSMLLLVPVVSLSASQRHFIKHTAGSTGNRHNIVGRNDQQLRKAHTCLMMTMMTMIQRAVVMILIIVVVCIVDSPSLRDFSAGRCGWPVLTISAFTASPFVIRRNTLSQQPWLHQLDLFDYHSPSVYRYDRRSSSSNNKRRTQSMIRFHSFTLLLSPSSSSASSVVVTNNTDLTENTTASSLKNDYNHANIDDTPPPVVSYEVLNDTLQLQKSEPARPDSNNHSLIQPQLSIPIPVFHQLLNRLLNSIQHDMSSNEIVRTAMTIEELWKQRSQHYNNDNENGDMISSFNIVLRAWCKTCQILLEFHDSNSMIPTTSTTTGSSTATTSQSSKQKNIISLLEMQMTTNGTKIPEIQIDVGNVNIYTAKDAATHATELLMGQLTSSSSSSSTLSNQNNSHMKPNRTSFHIVMEAWSKSHDVDAPYQVHELIQRMEQKYHIKPDTVTYNLYIDSIAHGKAGSSTTNYRERIERINNVLKEMESCPTATTNTQTINSILHAYSTTIGKYVVQLNYHQVDENKRISIEGEIESLLTNVLRMFNDLKMTYEQTKNAYNQPDIITYTTVMECFARHGTIQSTEQVEALFCEMKQINSTSTDSNTSTNHKRSVKPSVYTYSTVIKAWSRTYHPKAPHRADELLNECIAMYQQGEDRQRSTTGSVGYQTNHQHKLTSVVFTSVIQCWARSQEPTKAVRVLQLLQQMRAMAEDLPAVAPTSLTYNTAIDACTKTRGTPAQQTAALKIAFAIFKTMEITNNIIPNHVTFGTLLKAISSLVPLGDETRNTLSKAVFEKAIKASQVDRNVIQQLQKSCDTNVLQSLLLSSSDPNNRMIQTNNNGHIDYDKVPSHWSKNVRLP